MFFLRLFPLLLLAPGLILATEAHENAGIALVIGNSNYHAVSPLANPVNDAKLMAATLTQLHFNTSVLFDGDQTHMKQAIIAFGEELKQGGKDTVGLFYYAGHGVQINGRNFLIPIDAVLKSNKDFGMVAINVDTILETMKIAHNRLNFVILDACRNAPFVTNNRTLSFERGLARMQAAHGMLIAYSTSPGDIATDGDGNNSPYTLALANAMLQPKLAVERMFRYVRNTVMQATQKCSVSTTSSQRCQAQIPWESSSLTGDDYFFNPGITSPPKPQITTAQPDYQALSLYMDFLTSPPNGKEFRPFSDGDTLYSGDLYRIVIRPEMDGYLYIFQVDAVGTIQRIFPMAKYGNRRLNNLNPVQRNTSYILPARNKAFYLDDTQGKETIYVFASRQPRLDIEDLSIALENAQARHNSQVAQAVKNKLTTLFKSRGLPLVATPAPQNQHSPVNITGFFNNICASCVHVLEFMHR